MYPVTIWLKIENKGRESLNSGSLKACEPEIKLNSLISKEEISLNAGFRMIVLSWKADKHKFSSWKPL